ncbi:MAG: DUF6141 family protein [Actinomycetia bacterium]|nr:DUF6141 family protein [Actinomycetes bacterium]
MLPIDGVGERQTGSEGGIDSDGSARSLGGGDAGPSPVPLFREAQRFRQWFFYVPVAIVTAVVWWQFIQQIGLGRPVGEEPLPDWLAWTLTIIFGLGFPAFAALVRLITEVTPGELSIRLYPFRATRIPLVEVGHAECREYSPMREYGGWGIRVGRLSGRAYNASGNQGVQLIMRDGRRILVGSQRPEQLLAALRAAGLGS